MNKTTQSIDHVPDAYMVRAKELCEWLGIGRATLWRWQREGNICKPVRLSPGVTAWTVGDIRIWLKSRSRG
ncbi:MAG: AlpA family phage regulatory protein [Bdellovibrionales bacterium]|nr:AlpA family phage regulatory protein [Ramlibacter sp.]